MFNIFNVIIFKFIIQNYCICNCLHSIQAMFIKGKGEYSYLCSTLKLYGFEPTKSNSFTSMVATPKYVVLSDTQWYSVVLNLCPEILIMIYWNSDRNW